MASVPSDDAAAADLMAKLAAVDAGTAVDVSASEKAAPLSGTGAAGGGGDADAETKAADEESKADDGTTKKKRRGKRGKKKSIPVGTIRERELQNRNSNLASAIPCLSNRHIDLLHLTFHACSIKEARVSRC